MPLGSAVSRRRDDAEIFDTDAPDLDGLSRRQLEEMAQAGGEVLECMRVLARTGDCVVSEALRDGGVFCEWDHYPGGDIIDLGSHSQYFYHAHRDGEHGHFHTFLRYKGMPRGLKPVAVPGFDLPNKKADLICHLVGFSMDKFGIPIGVFTPNLWLTGDHWYGAADVCKMIDHFEIDHAQVSWPMNRWITNMFVLFHPQIIRVLHERDARIEEWGHDHPGVNVYTDRDLDIISFVPISIDDQIAAVNDALSH